jgi:hypothetical protein
MKRWEKFEFLKMLEKASQEEPGNDYLSKLLESKKAEIRELKKKERIFNKWDGSVYATSQIVERLGGNKKTVTVRLPEPVVSALENLRDKYQREAITDIIRELLITFAAAEVVRSRIGGYSTNRAPEDQFDEAGYAIDDIEHLTGFLKYHLLNSLSYIADIESFFCNFFDNFFSYSEMKSPIESGVL